MPERMSRSMRSGVGGTIFSSLNRLYTCPLGARHHDPDTGHVGVTILSFPERPLAYPRGNQRTHGSVFDGK
jgi:hypothetical protein